MVDIDGEKCYYKNDFYYKVMRIYLYVNFKLADNSYVILIIVEGSLAFSKCPNT